VTQEICLDVGRHAHACRGHDKAIKAKYGIPAENKAGLMLVIG